MIPITADELAQVVESLHGLVTGVRVEKIVEPDPESLLIVTRGENLHLCIIPELGHLGALEKISRGESSTFTMLLRKHVGNAFIKSLALLRPNDRLLAVDFSTGHRLVAEFTGRHGNLLLLDPEGVILGLHHFSASTTRTLRTGFPYEPPPAPREERTLPLRFGNAHDATAFFGPWLKERRRQQCVRAVCAGPSRELNRARRALGALKRDRERCISLTAEQRLGELYLIAKWQWPDGSRALRLDPAPDGGSPITLTLPTGCAGPVAAAQLHFAHAKKGKRGLEHVAKRERELEARCTKLERELERLRALPLEELAVLVTQSLPAHTTRIPEGSTPRQSTPRYYRQFAAADGTPILVGRGDRENHLLTFRTARGNDCWFHVRDLPGAHVILPGVQQPTQEQLLDAATLALHFSDQRAEGRGEVIYTLRKYLRPVKGAPGKVTVGDSKTISIYIEPGRLKRLLETKVSQPQPTKTGKSRKTGITT